MKSTLLTIVTVAVFAEAVTRVDGKTVEYEDDIVADLNGVESLRILGDYVTVESRNVSSSKSDWEGYVENHFIRINLLGEAIDIDLTDLMRTESDFEGRGRLKKIILPILLALKIKTAIIVPVFMSIIGLIAVKGLFSGMAALFISKMLAFKSLLHKHHLEYHPKVTYDVPHHVHEYWDRNEADKPYILYYPAKRTRASNREEDIIDSNFYKSDPWEQWDKDQFEDDYHPNPQWW